MTIAIVNCGSNTSSSLAAGASLSVTVPSGGIPLGSLVIVYFSLNSNSTVTAADSRSNTYNSLNSSNYNNNAANGFISLWWVWNLLTALQSGDTISVVNGNVSTAIDICMGAFGATGILSTSSPRQTSFAHTAFGSSAAPSVTSAAAATSGSLILGYTGGSNAPSITQDSTNGAYAAPPVARTTANEWQEGGTITSGLAQSYTYAPTLGGTSFWGAIVEAFTPAPSSGGSSRGGLLLFGVGGSIGWTPSLVGAAAWKVGQAIHRNGVLTRRSLLTGR